MPYGSKQHIPPTNCLLLTAKQEPYKKAYLLTKNIEEFPGKSSGDWASRQKKDRKSNRIRQKNKRGDSKVEWNDSPEVPDRGETSDILSLASGCPWRCTKQALITTKKTKNVLRVRNAFSLQNKWWIKIFCLHHLNISQCMLKIFSVNTDSNKQWVKIFQW